MGAPCISTLLSTGINSAGCDNQVVGVEKRAIIIPRSYVDLDSIAYDSGTVIINTFELAGASTGVALFENAEMPFKMTKVDGERGEYNMKFNSTFGFKILGNSPAKVKQVIELCNDSYFVILQAKSYSAADKNKYILLAPTKSLDVTTVAFSMENQDGFGWVITMMEKEAVLPLAFIWDTDETTTDALIASLYA